jgi:hypothetical protein
MAEMVDQKLFTQEELRVMAFLSESCGHDEPEIILYLEEGKTLVQVVRRLALRISQLQELVEAGGS